nr:immunoglobulin heavy chain junction region [Macaca mulatta]MOV50895.1 immunoglobulin heavy chain junction region [Macaca mulatta]MOV51189.1 immunoglobulin heavy chain junction region [Macaca mulatta]MOV51363.1 immunoglobulin heavy chain junction region [Macaca mulatta]MOV52054.1 immunoglobulin heavy chain junction region [Macaca mulatta]
CTRGMNTVMKDVW